MIPYLTGDSKGQPHDQLFWRKLKVDGTTGMALRSGDLKVMSPAREREKEHLYNLSEDIGETRNQRGIFPEEVTLQMIEVWEAWESQLKNRSFPSLVEDEWWDRSVDG